jgi:hypothetical protein
VVQLMHDTEIHTYTHMHTHIQRVKSEKVPGSQIMNVTIKELMHDLEICTHIHTQRVKTEKVPGSQIMHMYFMHDTDIHTYTHTYRGSKQKRFQAARS